MLPPAGGGVVSVLLVLDIGSRVYDQTQTPPAPTPCPEPEYHYSYYSYEASPKLLLVSEEKEVSFGPLAWLVFVIRLALVFFWLKIGKKREVKTIQLK